MADVVVDATANATTELREGLWGPYWTSPSVGYIVYTDIAGITVQKTTDSGATWTEQDTDNNPSSDNRRSMAAWFDQETKDDSGTVIHIAWVRRTDNDVRYVQFDTSTDTFGTIRTVDALTISSTSTDSDISVTKAKSGRVYVAARGDFEQDTENTDHSMRSSSDGFATNNESELSPYSADEEMVLLLPGSAADESDIAAVVIDAVNGDLEFWKFDASANTWGVTTIDAGIAMSGAVIRANKRFYDATTRHSDEHILLAYWTERDSATGDFKSVDITQATPTITAKTNLDTDGADSFFPTILINQQNDDVYVAYAGTDANDETLFATVQVYFKKSTDGMGAWGTEQAYGILDDDIRLVSLGRTVGDSGGRVMPAFFNDDLSDILVNDGNDVEIAAAAGGTPVSQTFAMPWTSLQGILQPKDMPWESRQSIVRVKALPWESRQPIARTFVISWTSNQGIVWAFAISWESRGFIAETRTLPWESRLPVVTQTFAMPWTSNQGIAQALALSWESRQSIVETKALPWEAGGFVIQTFALPWTANQGITQTAALPWTANQGMAQTFALPWTSLQGIAEALGLPWDSGGFAVRALTLPWESRQPIIQTKDLPWTANQGILRVLALPWTSNQGVAQTGGLPWESGGFAVRALVLPWESYQPIAETKALPWTSNQGIAQALALPWTANQGISQSGLLPWEAGGFVLQTGVLPWESRQPVARMLVLPWTANQGMAQTFALPWTSLQGIAEALGLPWESKQSLSQTAVLPWTSNLLIARVIVLPWESRLPVVTQTVAMPWESRGFIVVVIALPWESATGVIITALRVPLTEHQVDRDTRDFLTGQAVDRAIRDYLTEHQVDRGDRPPLT